MKQQGFTIVEMVVIVSVLAIILCIAIPALRSATMRANDGASVSAVRLISQAQNQKFLSAGQYQTLNQLVAEGFLDIRFKDINPAGTDATYSGYSFKYTDLPPLSADAQPNYILSAKPVSTSILAKTGTRRCGISNQSLIYCDKSDIESHFTTEADLYLAPPFSEN